MTRPTFRLSAFGVAAVALSAILWPAGAATAQDPNDRAVLRRFQLEVNDYLAVRWLATRNLPPPRARAPSTEIVAALEQRVHAVQRARTQAGPPAVFSDEVAVLLRRVIAETLEEYDISVTNLLKEINSEAPQGLPRPRANERFDWRRGAAMPMVFIEALPTLPYGLQYRFVDRDLVVLDVDLGLILDVMPEALPKPER